MRIRNLGIQQKLMVSFVLILMGINLITSFFYKKSEEQAVQNVIETYMGNLTYAGKLLTKELGELETAYYFLSSSPVVQNALRINISNKQQYFESCVETLDVISTYFSRTGLINYIAAMRIYGENGIVLRDGGNFQFEQEINADTVRDYVWYTPISDGQKNLSWFGITRNSYYSDKIIDELIMQSRTGNNEESRAYVFGVVGNILNSSTLRPAGTVYLSFYPGFFSNLLEDFDNNDKETTFIVDHNGFILFNQDRSAIGTHYEDNAYLRGLVAQPGYFITNEDDLEFLTAYYPIADNGWYLIKKIEFTEITGASRLDFNKNISISLSMSCIALLMWHIIVSRMILPIKALGSAMELVQEDNLLVSVDDNSQDEIGVLSRNFNYMIGRINRLFHQVVEEQSQKKQMEFIALQAQINPHFLQNTLNSIRWMAVIQRATNIKDLTDALSRLLINVTNKVDLFITLREELVILEDYIFIQKIRYGDKFSVWYQIEPGLLSHRCLKFILQPILENAIYHGIEPKDDIGVILISAWTDEAKGVAVISVQDDGIGVSTQRIDEVLHLENGGSSRQFSGIGLRNLDERLKLIYGDDYGIEIQSEVGAFTSITIRFPLEFDAREVGSYA